MRGLQIEKDQDSVRGDLMAEATNSDSLFKRWGSAKSLESGNSNFIRYDVNSKAGKEALALYAKAVGNMKERPNSDPYSWNQQAGIHGSLLLTVDALKTKAPELGFSQNGDGTPLTAQDVTDGNTVLNNCTHFSSFWSGFLLNGNSDEPSSSIPQDITPNFLPWHRLYLQSHESVVREVLRQMGEPGWENWALPYWDYTKDAQMPKLLRGEGRTGNSALYEPSRSISLNSGGSLKKLLEPRSDIIPMMMQDELGKPISVFEYQKRGKDKALVKTQFQTFSSHMQQVPHNNMHDVLGGLADGLTNKEIILEATDNYANSIWDVQGFADEIRADVMSPTSTTAPGLMGLVPTAASDPVFWVHHSFIDRIWSSWNASPYGSYITESTLSKHPWNYQFFEAGEAGKPELTTYSKWGGQSGEVIKNIYQPNYTYDRLDADKTGGSAQPLQALLNQPRFAPVIDKEELNETASELSFQTINPNLPLSSKQIVDLQKRGITLNANISYEACMNASRNVALLVGDQKFLSENAQALKTAYTSWDGTSFNPEGIFRSVLNSGEGNFSPWTIDSLQVGAINLLPMGMTMEGNGTTMNHEMSHEMSHDMSHEMSPDMSHDMCHGSMPGSISVDITDALAVQSLGNLLPKSAEVGLMIAVTDPTGQDAKDVVIRNISFSLSQSAAPGKGKRDLITGNTFDGATYIAEHPSVVESLRFASNPEKHYERIGKKKGWDRPTLADRAENLGEAYLAANPDLNQALNQNPFAAVDHYLSTGIFEGRPLGI